VFSHNYLDHRREQ